MAAAAQRTKASGENGNGESENRRKKAVYQRNKRIAVQHEEAYQAAVHRRISNERGASALKSSAGG